MAMILRAMSLDGMPLSQPISARFDSAGGTIGRSDQNTMALPDPKRYISRQHARIAAKGGGFVIENISKDNAIVVRQLTLSPGESAPLRQHDAVHIGGYLLEVVEARADDDLDAAETIATPLRRRAEPPLQRAPAPAFTTPSRGFTDDGLPPLSPGNPFASLLMPAESGFAASGLDTRAPEEDMPRLPPNLDLLKPRRPEPAASANPFEDMILQPSQGLSIDALLGSDDAPAGPGAEMLAGHSDRVPELRGAFNPPRAMPAPVQRPAPVHQVVDIPIGKTEAPRPFADSGDEQDLWSAFCRGAGVTLDAQASASAATMEQAGSLLRLAIEGTLQLMSLRASTRNELHAQVTVIRSRENNPLKFSPDAATALERLLQPPSRGFLPGETAMAEAMSELVGHTIGTMAGMRAALEGVLERFTPEELEAKLDGNGVLDRVLPMTRKSRLWELYLQHYDTIRDAAQEDFHALFGKAFLAAYEQQVDRLRAEWGSRSG